ncbi:MAG: arylsulfatase [Pirellulales bacterium]|nr:arylsulfatase [Pirellulales bacterium]
MISLRQRLGVLGMAMLVTVASLAAAHAADRPNIVVILADDLGYGEVGCYGQSIIQTPRLDQMAAEGMRFTHFYAGATVCAPSRSVLMTGQHHGHTRVRGNAGRTNPQAQALLDEDVTVAEVLAAAGYRTALFGKWGLGDVGGAESGLPRKQGFAEFFGYLNQHRAHNHFPDYLWENEAKVMLKNVVEPVGDFGGGYATKQVEFADDLFAERALEYVSRESEQPFFLYWSLVVPHANNERTRALGNGANVPDFGPYAEEDWPEQDKGHAAMITRLDQHVGRLLDRLKEQGIAENTLVIFTSDNGPHNESRHSLDRFTPSGPYSGIKRSLTDGGIRVPTICWWPGTVPAGSESGFAGSFADVMATAADLAGTDAPGNTDSLSLVPELTGHADQQPQHDYLYWEFHEGGFRQACLYQGRWKGIRRLGEPLQLFDTDADVAEQNDVAAAHSDLSEKLASYLDTARWPNPNWEPQPRRR